MNPILNDIEARVLGALIEKEIATPEYYPLSLNALVAACNQSSNRNPVMHLEQAQVEQALDTLREKKLVHRVDRGESRVAKYRHVVYEALNLKRPDIAILCVLLLRGPQTAGEIRTRSNRLYDFSSLEEVDTILNALMTRDSPLVLSLGRQAGQKEVRVAHLLCGEPKTDTAESEVETDRIERLEREVEDLKRQFAEFRKQFE